MLIKCICIFHISQKIFQHQKVYTWRNLVFKMTSLWARWRFKSPASRLFTQSFIQAQIKETIKAPRHWLLCGKFTGDRWIPRTKDQLRGKCFHLMTSSYGPSRKLGRICTNRPTPERCWLTSTRICSSLGQASTCTQSGLGPLWYTVMVHTAFQQHGINALKLLNGQWFELQ